MNATEQMKKDLSRDPEDLAREADSARAHLEGTVDELMQQFAPGELMNKGISFIQSKADYDFLRNLTRQVENNPIPTILATVSLVWLMNASKQPSMHGKSHMESHNEESLTDRLGKKAAATRDKLSSATSNLGSSSHDAAERTRETGHRVAAGASDAMHRVSDASRNTADSARSGLRSAREGTTQMLRDHPLLIGALAGVVGAGLGSLLARTSAEDRAMGELSDRGTDAVMEKTEEKLHEAQEKVSPETAGGSDASPGSSTTSKTATNRPASGGSQRAEGSPKAEGSPRAEGSPMAQQQGSSKAEGSSGAVGAPNAAGARQPSITPPKLDPTSPGSSRDAGKPRPGTNH